MAEAYLGEIRMFAGNFAPQGWALCNGQLLPISQNNALYSILGTSFGGDGVTTFGLPNMQSRVPLHWGAGQGLTSYRIAESGGSESVTLLNSEMPAHTHLASASNQPGKETDPSGNLWAIPADSSGAPGIGYNTAPPNAQLSPFAISAAGGSQPHTNVQPFLAVSFIIALIGIFPTRG